MFVVVLDVAAIRDFNERKSRWTVISVSKSMLLIGYTWGILRE